MRFRMVSMVASAMMALGISAVARATISVPNSGSGNCGLSPCLSITHTGNGVGIQGTGGLIGIQASSDHYGISASSPNVAVQAISTGITGFAVSAQMSPSNTTGAAVFADGYNTIGVRAYSNTNAAVYAYVNPANAGSAVYGDAGLSSSALAGYFYGNVIVVSDLTVQGAIHGTIVGPSDARLKKDVKAEVGSLKVLESLRPVNYRWKNSADGEQLQHGLIAQEVQKVLPELVQENSRTGMLGVNYVGVVPLVVGAVQEQQRVISQQEARIAALEARLRSSTVSSTSGYTGLGIAIGLLPIGLVLGLRRRRSKND